MSIPTVEFQFITGLKRAIFRNARLRGSWDGSGRYSDDWTESLMQEEIGVDGCPIFTASISLQPADQDNIFKWGVILDGPQGANFWGIPTEVQDVNSVARHRQFRLNRETTMPQIERYFFTYGRCLGANKHFTAGCPTPSLRFGIWAPNAKNVEVVFGNPASGYIADDNSGVSQAQPVITLTKLADGIWEGGPQGNCEMLKACLTCNAS